MPPDMVMNSTTALNLTSKFDLNLLFNKKINALGGYDIYVALSGNQKETKYCFWFQNDFAIADDHQKLFETNGKQILGPTRSKRQAIQRLVTLILIPLYLLVVYSGFFCVGCPLICNFVITSLLFLAPMINR